MRKIMIIGASGFVGTHLIRRRAADGNCRIVAVDIKQPRERLPGVEYVTHDVRDLSSLSGHDDVDMIYNLAAVHTTPGHEFWEYYDTNVRGATQTVAYARIHGVKHIVFTSSISVYGPSEEQKDENSVPAPTSAYGWSKLLAEDVFREWLAATVGAKLLIVRPAVVFGHGEGGNFTRLAKLLRRGVFVYPGRRDTVKASIYVKDLIRYIDAMWARSGDYALFNAAYAERYQLQEVVGRLKHYFPAARELTLAPSVMITAARLIGMLPNNIGIHPERILKLMNSTNVYPKTLAEAGLLDEDPLPRALEDWRAESLGAFT